MIYITLYFHVGLCHDSGLRHDFHSQFYCLSIHISTQVASEVDIYDDLKKDWEDLITITRLGIKFARAGGNCSSPKPALQRPDS